MDEPCSPRTGKAFTKQILQKSSTHDDSGIEIADKQVETNERVITHNMN